MSEADKPRARLNGRVWTLTPPTQRRSYATHYLSTSIEAAYEHWFRDMAEFERKVASHSTR